jgi:hypothetical protein
MTTSISRAVALALLLLTLSPPLLAYRLPWNSVNSGGRPGSLSGYMLNGSVSQTVQGKGAATGYMGAWGFWSPIWTTGTIDVGVNSILEPSGVIDTIMETPKSTVHNFGTATRDVTAWFEIRDSTRSVVYLQSAVAPGLAGGDEATVPFPNWDVPNDKDGRYYAGSWTALDGDHNPANDTTRSQFAVEARQQGPPAWTQRADVPVGPQNRAVQHGAAAATDPQGLFVFLLKGNNTCEFYRYDPASAAWLTLDSVPARGRDNVPRTVKEGGTLAQAGGRFYATKGGNSLEFWEFNPAASPGRRWTQKADVPAGAAGVHAGASAAGVTIGTRSCVYLLKASGTFEFYRYDIVKDSWSTMAPAPGLPGEEFKTGSCITSDGGDTIFVLKGIFDKFYAYVVSSNTWLTRSDLPLGPDNKQAKGGAAICYHFRSVYCLKGSNSQEFWIFDCNAGTWSQGPDVTLGPHKSRVQDGGALVYCSSSRYLYATKGGCLEFWSYGRLSNYNSGTMSSGQVALDALTPYRLDVNPSVVTGRARIGYALPLAGNVELALYDAAGRLAKTLVKGTRMPGVYTACFASSELARGVYIVRYRSGDYKASHKLIIE